MQKFKEKIRSLGIPLSLCSLFYACLCIFSLTVGLYYWIGGMDLNMIELSQNAVHQMESMFSAPLATVFGILTFSVGVLQGLSSYGIFKFRIRGLYGFAIGFTVFSLLSCSSKLFMSVNAFSIVKIIAYVAVLVILIKRIGAKKN